jgi:repressor of nif and glnA expression
MSFNPNIRRGKIILNISTIHRDAIDKAVAEITRVYEQGLSMGNLLAWGKPGTTLGEYHVPDDQYAIGTICSVTINGVLLRSNIATHSRFGGLLEFRDHKPFRFTHMINYDGTTLDPLEIFIKGKMTRVRDIIETGNGIIGASFREVPAVALPDVNVLIKKLEKVGMGGVLMVGKPNQTLLDVPVTHDRAGLVVVGGLSPLSAVEESGIPTHNLAMNTLFDFDMLIPWTDLKRHLAA